MDEDLRRIIAKSRALASEAMELRARSEELRAKIRKVEDEALKAINRRALKPSE